MNNFFSKVYCLVLTLLIKHLLLVQAFGQDDMSLHAFLINQYEIESQTWSISQCPGSHFIYLANSSGLMEFNGISWKNHFPPNEMPVRSVLANREGRIFTGSFEEFGYWQHDENNELVYHSLSHLTEIKKNDEIWKIYDHQGEIHFQSFTSIYMYDFETVRQVTAKWTMFFTHQVENRLVSQIITHGLFWFENDSFIFIDNSELFTEKRVHAILPYGDGGLLIATHKDGLFVYDGNSFSYFESEASNFLKRFTCNNAIQLSDTTFAFGSILNGTIIADLQGSIQRNYNTGNGLMNNTVLSLFRDSDDGLWIGLDAGINYIDLSSPFIHYKSRNGSLGTIYALLVHSDNLYIGTNHGLFKATIDKKGHLYNFRDLQFIEGSQGQVWALKEAGGHILCGHNEGTFLVKDDQFKKISHVTGGWNFHSFNEYIISGTYTGIVFLEKDISGEWMFRNKVQGFSEPTRYLEIDYLGYVWASHHQRGIFQLELSDDLMGVNRVQHFSSIDGRIFNIKVFKVNNRVVFSTPENIYTFDFVRNEIVPFTPLSDELEEYRVVTHIQHFEKNKYWFIREDKMALFEIGMDFSATKIYEIEQKNTQLPQRTIEIVNIDEKTLLIPTLQNFNTYNLDIGKTRDGLSRLKIQKMLFFGKNDTIVKTDPEQKISIPWNVNSIIISISDPSNFDQTAKDFQYRIKEIDASWQNINADNFTYLNIKHGDYTLEIRHNDRVIQSYFSISKPWFISHLAIFFYVLIFMLLIWGLVLFFRFEIRRHKELISLELKQSSLQSELDYKSHELMMTMRHLIMKDEILNDIQKQITSIREQSSKYPIKYINNLERIVNRGLGSSSDEWENAIQNLKLSQQGFFKYLKDKYPDLTPNDLRLCSFLRLNFSTKEIAQLLNVSARGVETSRHRLRKKMNLGKKQNLTEFLIKLDWEADQ